MGWAVFFLDCALNNFPFLRKSNENTSVGIIQIVKPIVYPDILTVRIRCRMYLLHINKYDKILRCPKIKCNKAI